MRLNSDYDGGAVFTMGNVKVITVEECVLQHHLLVVMV